MDLRLKLPDGCDGRPSPLVSEAELGAIESVPRLVLLDCRRRDIGSSAPLRRLLSHPSLGGLTALHCCRGEMDAAGMALLPLHQPRLRTLSLGDLKDDASGNTMLTPLSQLATLTDLRLFRRIGQRHVAVLAQCASLRRLSLYQSPLFLLVSLLMAPALAQLQSLSLDFCEAVGNDGPDAAAEAWAAIFSHLRCLRSLTLWDGDDLGVLWRGVAAAHAAATAAGSRGSSALRAGALQLDEAADSQLPPLATNCPRRWHLHVHDAAGNCVGSGALDWLVGTPAPTDQPLHSLTDARATAVGGGGTLRRLHVSYIRDEVLRPALLLPKMHLLETLSIGELSILTSDRKSWECCLNHLRSLCALHVDMSGGIEVLLKVLRRTTPWSLRSLRIRLRRVNRRGGETIDTQEVADLLDRMPALTVGSRSAGGAACARRPVQESGCAAASGQVDGNEAEISCSRHSQPAERLYWRRSSRLLARVSWRIVGLGTRLCTRPTDAALLAQCSHQNAQQPNTCTWTLQRSGGELRPALQDLPSPSRGQPIRLQCIWS